MTIDFKLVMFPDITHILLYLAMLIYSNFHPLEVVSREHNIK